MGTRAATSTFLAPAASSPQGPPSAGCPGGACLAYRLEHKAESPAPRAKHRGRHKSGSAQAQPDGCPGSPARLSLQIHTLAGEGEMQGGPRSPMEGEQHSETQLRLWGDGVGDHRSSTRLGWVFTPRPHPALGQRQAAKTAEKCRGSQGGRAQRYPLSAQAPRETKLLSLGRVRGTKPRQQPRKGEKMHLLEQGEDPAWNCKVSAQADHPSGALLSGPHLGSLMQEPEKKGRRRREASCHPHLLHTAQEYRPKNGDGTGREGDLERQNLQPKCPSQTSACNREPRASQAHPASLLQPCQQSPRVGTDPRRDLALAPAPQRPARCCLPGSPCPHQGLPPPPADPRGP